MLVELAHDSAVNVLPELAATRLVEELEARREWRPLVRAEHELAWVEQPQLDALVHEHVLGAAVELPEELVLRQRLDHQEVVAQSPLQVPQPLEVP